MVVIELVGGLCNSHCRWCFLNYKGVSRVKRGMMDFEHFSRFIDLNREGPFPIIPFGHGEALINPDFVECCEYALANSFQLLSLHTNFSMRLTERHFTVLSRFEHMTVNVGGGVSETHAWNTGTSLDTILSNVETLSRRMPCPSLEIKLVLNRRSLGEVDALRERVASVSPELSVSVYPLYFGPADSDEEDRRRFFEENLATSDGSLVDERIPCRDRVRLTPDGVVEVTSKLDHCYGLTTTVRWDGSVSICCRSRYHEAPVGDAFREPMIDILNSRNYHYAVALGEKREYVEFCKYCS